MQIQKNKKAKPEIKIYFYCCKKNKKLTIYISSVLDKFLKFEKPNEFFDYLTNLQKNEYYIVLYGYKLWEDLLLLFPQHLLKNKQFSNHEIFWFFSKHEKLSKCIFKHKTLEFETKDCWFFCPGVDSDIYRKYLKDEGLSDLDFSIPKNALLLIKIVCEYLEILSKKFMQFCQKTLSNHEEYYLAEIHDKDHCIVAMFDDIMQKYPSFSKPLFSQIKADYEEQAQEINNSNFGFFSHEDKYECKFFCSWKFNEIIKNAPYEKPILKNKKKFTWGYVTWYRVKIKKFSWLEKYASIEVLPIHFPQEDTIIWIEKKYFEYIQTISKIEYEILETWLQKQQKFLKYFLKFDYVYKQAFKKQNFTQILFVNLMSWCFYKKMLDPNQVVDLFQWKDGKMKKMYDYKKPAHEHMSLSALYTMYKHNQLWLKNEINKINGKTKKCVYPNYKNNIEWKKLDIDNQQ